MKTPLTLLLTVSVLAAFSGRANLLVNGSFEEGDYTGSASWTGVPSGGTAVTGWTATPAGFDWHQDANQVPGAEFGPAFDGKRMIDLTSGMEPGGITQVFSTVPGEDYLLSWAVAAPADPSTYDVSVAGLTESFSVVNSDRMNLQWVVETFAFTADSTSTTLTFQGTTGNYWGAVIDAVSVTSRTQSVPDTSSTLNILGASFVALAAFRRRCK